MSELADFHFIAFFFDLILIYILLERNRRARLNLVCAGVLACGAFWSLSYGLIHRSPTPEFALFWVNVSALGWCSVPAGILWFYVIFANRQEKFAKPAIQASIALPGLFFLAMQWSGNLITEMTRAPFGWIAFWPRSVTSYLFFAYYGAIIAVSLWLLIQTLREARTTRLRQQARLLLLTFPVTVFIGLTTDIILPALHIMVLPLMADAAFLFFDIGLVVAITRYGLMGLTTVAAYEDIMRTITDSMVLLNLQGRLVYANQATSTFTGIKTESLVGRLFPELTANPSTSGAILDTVYREDREYNGELVYRGAEDGPVTVMASITPVRDRAQETLGLLVLARNITRQKQAEAELRSYRDLIDAILNALPEAVVMVGPDLTIEFANDTACRLFDVTRAECTGRSLKLLLPAPELSRTVEQVNQTGNPSAAIEMRLGPDAHERVISAQVISMGSQRTLTILRDITEDRKRQDQLYLADRLSSVGEMAAGIAHELNNPLTSVLGLAETLETDTLPAETREDIRAISQEAQRAAQVVRNLLTFARQHPVTRKPVQLNEVIREVLRLRAYEHRVHDIDVQPVLSPDLPEVSADRFQLQQVFLNIVLNAEQAMASCKGPRVLVIVSRRMEGNVRICITDSGPGIRAEDLPRIFNPFFTTKEVGKGTGLGLSICYGIITDLGGRIWTESPAGQGAVFYIELPAASVQA